MQILAELICGDGYVPNWEAISAIATALAVLVALWIRARERSRQRSDRLEAEVRAGVIVSQSLASTIRLFPSIVPYIRRTEGVIIESPAMNVLYGIDACREILEKEAFFNQLPTHCLGLGALVCSFARKWCFEIDVRLQTQRNADLRKVVDWQNHDFTCHLGEEIHKHAVGLKEKCAGVMEIGAIALLPFPKRLAAKLRELCGKRETP